MSHFNPFSSKHPHAISKHDSTGEGVREACSDVHKMIYSDPRLRTGRVCLITVRWSKRPTCTTTHDPLINTTSDDSGIVAKYSNLPPGFLIFFNGIELVGSSK